MKCSHLYHGRRGFYGAFLPKPQAEKKEFLPVNCVSLLNNCPKTFYGCYSASQCSNCTSDRP